jgi:quinol monooxygenase YgiN
MTAKVFLSLFNKVLIGIAMCLTTSNTYAIEKSSNGNPLSANDEDVTVLTRYEVKKGCKKKFRKVLRMYVQLAVTDKNNIMAEGYYEQENSSIFWVIERWDNKRGLEKMRVEFKLAKLLADKKLVQPAKVIYVKDLEPISKEEWRRAPR